MSELSILVPLQALPADTTLTSESILSTLTDSLAARSQVEHLEQKCDHLLNMFRNAGSSLALILDEVEDEYEKLKALRKFAVELKEAGAAL